MGLSGLGASLAGALDPRRFTPEARLQDLARRARNPAGLREVAREVAVLPRDLRERLLGGLKGGAASALRAALAELETAGPQPSGPTGDVVERTPSSPFSAPATRLAAPQPTEGLPLPDLLDRAESLVGLAERATGSPAESPSAEGTPDQQAAPRLLDLARGIRGGIRLVVESLNRGASPEKAASIGNGLAELRSGLDAGVGILGRVVEGGANGDSDQARRVLENVLGLAGRLVRWLGPGPGIAGALLSRLLQSRGSGGGPAGTAPGSQPGVAGLGGTEETSLKQDLAAFLGGEGRTEKRQWEAGKGVDSREGADGGRTYSYDNGTSTFKETGATFGDADFSVDEGFLTPSGSSAGGSAVDRAVGAALDGIGELHKQGSFEHEASVVHEQGQVYVGNENAHFGAEGEISVLSASVSGNGRVDVSGGKLSASGHVEASATVVDMSGSIDARLGPASLQASGSAYVGAKATADGGVYLDPANGIYAAKVQAKAFAGATAEATAHASLGDVGSAEVGVGAWAGVGARFSLDAGFKDGEFKFKVDIGAALGVGLNINLGVSINFKKIGEKVGGFFKGLKSFFGGSRSGGKATLDPIGLMSLRDPTMGGWERRLAEAFKTTARE